MKKYILIACALLLLALAWDTAYYRLGWYIDLHPNQEVTAMATTEDKTILLDRGDGMKPFEIRGVNMGSGIPGEWSTNFQIDEETYLRWFEYISEMGANTIRIYTIQNEEFYNAFYKFNKDNENPLYLIHGVWINDYALNSRVDGYNELIYDTFLDDTKMMIDVVHGKKKLYSDSSRYSGAGAYKHDISEWVIGYILGIEWEDTTVAYTDEKYKGEEKYSSYKGTYMETTEEASPFEAMLTRVGDFALEYESERYKTQKLIAFTNWPTTDPFDYQFDVADFFMKCAKVDVEHIKTTDACISGQFASYHIYPYYPDILNYVDDWSSYNLGEISDYIKNGTVNTYAAYLNAISNHHSIPVVISEFGVSTGRGIAQEDKNTHRNQGHMSESGQGEAIKECYEDIMDAGCAGCCIFSWQDEWFKRTWNTMYAVNLTRNPFWSDYQTNEQYFGLLSFDTGEKESICYVDGDTSEWTDKDIVTQNGETELSMKYDEKFVYFKVKKKGLNIDSDKIYIPIDTTQKSGSNYDSESGLKFDRASDFLLVIDGKDNSELLVQEYYESLRSTYAMYAYGYNTYAKAYVPEKDSSKFVEINMLLQTSMMKSNERERTAEVFETGKLRYGNANPHSTDFDSLADFCSSGDEIEIKIPWQMLNFSDPSRMEIHDDYYEHYGIETMSIDCMYLGIATSNDKNSERITLDKVGLKGWGNHPTYHERLKKSYYDVQKMWKDTPMRFPTDKKAEKTNELPMLGENAKTILDVPVLMYHEFVNQEDLNNGVYFDEYAVWDYEFENDLKWLQRNGYTTVSVQDLINVMHGEDTLPEKPILISIDDGKYGVYKHAYPLLKQYGMKASLSLIVDRIDEASNHTEIRVDESAPYCIWPEIKEMADSGVIEMISHTYYYHVYVGNDRVGGTSLPGETAEDMVGFATEDYRKVIQKMNYAKIKFTNAMAYPYSRRTKISDEAWSITGYEVLLCGEDLADNENYFVREKGADSATAVISRFARMTGESFSEVIKQAKADKK